MSCWPLISWCLTECLAWNGPSVTIFVGINDMNKQKKWMNGAILANETRGTEQILY